MRTQQFIYNRLRIEYLELHVNIKLLESTLKSFKKIFSKPTII